MREILVLWCIRAFMRVDGNRSFVAKKAFSFVRVFFSSWGS